MNFSTSYGGFYSADTFNSLGSAAIGDEQGVCGGSSGSDLSYVFGQANNMRGNSGIQLVAFQHRDGGASGGRLYVAASECARAAPSRRPLMKYWARSPLSSRT